ncbi:MAG TPA: hypothetical protein VFW73_03285 [Lacipirellulaceae bacterium]|nr:hypothetical protein [Lacipirellulaceae bacterium]
MVNFPGRHDRRRRVLKEEVLAASAPRRAYRKESRSEAADGAPRYSDAAGVENHPQITDFIPRRYSSIAFLILFGAVLTAISSALHYFVVPIAVSHGVKKIAPFDFAARGNLSDWLAAVVLFLTSGFCLMTYSIRRHRIDDYRGRYRIWLGAALACLILSINSVAGIHEVLADVLTRITGWSALRNGAAWWLTLAGLPLAWIFVRILLDVRECRVGTALLVASAACYGLSAATFLGYGPSVEPRVESILVVGLLLLGHWLVFAAVVSYSRFVVLDAQGLIPVRRRRDVKSLTMGSSAKEAKHVSTSIALSGPSTPAAATSRQTLQPAKTPVDSAKWLDGRRPERDHYEDDDDGDTTGGDRKLSKSERKRLRRLKTQNRAA